MGEVIQRLAPVPIFLDPGGPSPAGHVGSKCGHAFDGLGELTVQLYTLVQVKGPGKPEFGRFAVREGFARPGVGVEVVRPPGGDAEFVAATSDEVAAGFGFRSGLNDARAVLAVERSHALRFFFVADVVVPQHGRRSFHRAPSGTAGISALDAIRAAPEPSPRPSMFPEREAPLARPRRPGTRTGRAEEPPPDGRRLHDLAYGYSFPLGLRAGSVYPNSSTSFSACRCPMPATRRDSAMPIAVMAL